MKKGLTISHVMLGFGLWGCLLGLPTFVRGAETGPTGGGQPMSTLQPVLAMRYMIATTGIYPSDGVGGPHGGSEQALGEIRLFAGTQVPNGWASCEGQLLPISQNTALFSLLGTTFGGNGQNNFALPDLRGRAVVNFGQGPGLSDRTLGSPFGANTVVLNTANLPAHSHTVTGGATSPTGNSTPFANCQPSLPMVYAISPYGIWPYMSEIRIFPNSYVTGSFLPAQGQSLSIAENDTLFALIGTMYGGDGQTYFNLPDLRGRVAVEAGQGPGLAWAASQTGGAEQVSPLTSSMPNHTHTTAASFTGATGGSQVHNTLQPTLAVRYAIALQGYFPSFGGGGGIVNSTPMIGEVRPFAAEYLPNGWAFCDGQLLPINQNMALFSLLGTTYGGNGQTNFALPDLRGRTPIGQGSGLEGRYWSIGERGGSEYETIGTNNMPTHTHTQPPPEMDISGNSLSIADGDATPSATDHTLFPDTDPAGGLATRTYTVSNSGLGDLTLSGTPRIDLSGSTAFTVASLPAAVVPPGGSTTFQIAFDPPTTGYFTAAVSLLNEDPNEAPYNFTIAGNGVIPVASRHPGAVPGAGVAGAPLTIHKNTTDPTKLDLAWGASCGNGVTGYAVYEGTLGNYTSHALLPGACNTPDTSLSAIAPGAGNRYYLISAVDAVAGDEGSLGQSTAGEIPPAASPCRPAADLGPCG